MIDQQAEFCIDDIVVVNYIYTQQPKSTYHDSLTGEKIILSDDDLCVVVCVFGVLPYRGCNHRFYFVRSLLAGSAGFAWDNWLKPVIIVTSQL